MLIFCAILTASHKTCYFTSFTLKEMEAGELRKIIYLSRYGMPGESTVPNQVFFCLGESTQMGNSIVTALISLRICSLGTGTL